MDQYVSASQEQKKTVTQTPAMVQCMTATKKYCIRDMASQSRLLAAGWDAGTRSDREGKLTSTERSTTKISDRIKPAN